MSLSRNDIASSARDIIVICFSYPLPVEGRVGLETTTVFIGAGRRDSLVPVEQVDRLTEALESLGAGVLVLRHDAGHTITQAEVFEAGKWAIAAASGCG